MLVILLCVCGNVDQLPNGSANEGGGGLDVLTIDLAQCLVNTP